MLHWPCYDVPTRKTASRPPQTFGGRSAARIATCAVCCASPYAVRTAGWLTSSLTSRGTSGSGTAVTHISTPWRSSPHMIFLVSYHRKQILRRGRDYGRMGRGRSLAVNVTRFCPAACKIRSQTSNFRVRRRKGVVCRPVILSPVSFLPQFSSTI